MLLSKRVSYVILKEQRSLAAKPAPLYWPLTSGFRGDTNIFSAEDARDF